MLPRRCPLDLDGARCGPPRAVRHRPAARIVWSRWGCDRRAVVGIAGTVAQSTATTIADAVRSRRADPRARGAEDRRSAMLRWGAQTMAPPTE